MRTFLFALLILLAVSTQAHAWGLATHVELAETVLHELALLGSGVATLLLTHRRDFLRGNVLADVIVGKRLSRRRRSSHHWAAAHRLLTYAEDDRGKAFAYGFLTHLAADTVAHNHYVPALIQQTGSTVTLGHLYWELRADQLTAAEHRRTFRQLIKSRHNGHEQMLADHVYPELKWFALNRSVFARLNRLTSNRRFTRAFAICEDLSRWDLSRGMIDTHKAQACQRMLELLKLGRRSALTTEDPNGYVALNRLRIPRRTV